MSEQFVGEIRILPYPRGAPVGWLLCNGALLAIAQYEVLYQLLGTVYGGDGISTFAVPDLRGAVPIHQGQGPGTSRYVLAQRGGSENVTLTSQQMAQHTHPVIASATAASTTDPTTAVTAALASEPFYSTVASGTPTANFPSNTIGWTGGNQPHENTAPTLTVNFCISTIGVFPTQS